MSAPTATPQPPQSSALPPSHNPPNAPAHANPDRETFTPPSTESPKVKPQRKPLLRLQINDLSSAGSFEFLRLFHAAHALQDAVDAVLTHLYTGLPTSSIPPVRSITLVMRAMDGVAYTTGLELDGDHKEIHFNTAHIARAPESRRKEEIMGVVVHEMVHCWQHDGLGTAPGGLVEGVADWVRLKAGYVPPHWRRRTDCEWDAGYDRTAYFLEWLEREHGADVVRRINEAIRGCKYDEKKVWVGCCGKRVEELWEGYKEWCEEREEAMKRVEAEKREEEENEGGVKVDGDVDAEAGVRAESMQEDYETIRLRARRGGNMHIPVRPGVSS